MLTDLLPEDDQRDIACEGFGDFDFVKDEGPAKTADERKSYRQTDYDLSCSVGSARRVQLKPVIGLFNKDKIDPSSLLPYSD